MVLKCSLIWQNIKVQTITMHIVQKRSSYPKNFYQSSNSVKKRKSFVKNIWEKWVKSLSYFVQYIEY